MFWCCSWEGRFPKFQHLKCAWSDHAATIRDSYPALRSGRKGELPRFCPHRETYPALAHMEISRSLGESGAVAKGARAWGRRSRAWGRRAINSVFLSRNNFLSWIYQKALAIKSVGNGPGHFFGSYVNNFVLTTLYSSDYIWSSPPKKKRKKYRRSCLLNLVFVYVCFF